MTLYDVTLQILKNNQKCFNDIIWIGCEKFRISCDDFIILSKKIDSKTKNVLSKIPFDLVVVGKDFWLEREIYFDELYLDELSDVWRYKEIPKKPLEEKEIYALNIDESLLSEEEIRKDMHLSHYDYLIPKLKYLTK